MQAFERRVGSYKTGPGLNMFLILNCKILEKLVNLVHIGETSGILLAIQVCGIETDGMML